jgi:D-alanine-D-alanine ligase
LVQAPTAEKRAQQSKPTANRQNGKVKLEIDKKALKKLKLVAVAYSHVEREWFPTDDAYKAEVEVIDRAARVVEAMQRLGINAKGYPSDRYFLTNIIVDKPDLVLNLVDTLRGRDLLSTAIPGALELANIPYTGAEMRGLVIGSDRNMMKQLLMANDIPTPDYQFIQRRGTSVREDLGLPLIVKLNESGGSVGIDNEAVKKTIQEAQEKVNDMIGTYKLPVIVEKFIVGQEVTVIVFEDARKKHIFMAEKVFKKKPDGEHAFTSIESYDDVDAYEYRRVEDDTLVSKITDLAGRAFTVLRNKDYAKFDVRVEQETNTPYFTDCNPNTAFGPDQPIVEVTGLSKVTFEDLLSSLMTKYAKNL